MEAISSWQILVPLFFLVLTIIVLGGVAKKAGYSRWWSLMVFVPFANVFMIWMFAYAEWPGEKIKH